MKEWGQLALWCSHPLKHRENLSCLRQTPRQTRPGKTVRERERENEKTKGSGQGKRSGRDRELKCPHSDQYLCSRQNVPRSPGPFIKVMKSRVAHYESDSPVRHVLHRDTHGQILSSLDCSDAFVACKRSQDCRGRVWECQVKGKEAFLCGYTLAWLCILD